MDKQERKEKITEYKQRKMAGGVYVIKNQRNGRILLSGTTDLQGSKNRFEFAIMTNCCFDLKLQDDWKRYGAEAFSFEVIEELAQKETQTGKEFSEDISTLKELWQEKLSSESLY